MSRTYDPTMYRGLGGEFRKQDAEREESKVPVISIDYAFMGQEDQEGLTKILVVKDRKMKNIFSHPVRAKGAAGEASIAN